MSIHGTAESQIYDFFTSPKPFQLEESKKGVDVLKTRDPFRVAEMALEIQLERMHVIEAMNARDAVVQRLSDAYVSINQKNAAIEDLKREKGLRNSGLLFPSDLKADTTPGDEEKRKLVEHVTKLEGMVRSLQEDLKYLKSTNGNDVRSPGDPPPHYEEGRMHYTKDNLDQGIVSPQAQLRAETSTTPFMTSQDVSPIVSRSASLDSATPPTEILEASRVVADDPNELDRKIVCSVKEPEAMAKARYAILASLPLPADIPDDSLKPIIIPSPFTLHEFLGNASGTLRASSVVPPQSIIYETTGNNTSLCRLSNYRIFQELTTSWCPEREEHGYMLTPVFKCSTNPRVATAHRWTAVDVLAGMNKPTECFYNKDGNWYYAGIYKAFQLEDLTTKEWEALSNETAQIIIKDTISGRKNTSPQNVYETGQLYAAGALRVACVGLQCVGFNNAMYRAILELAGKCAQNGKWRGGAGTGLGLGTGGG